MQRKVWCSGVRVRGRERGREGEGYVKGMRKRKGVDKECDYGKEQRKRIGEWAVQVRGKNQGVSRRGRGAKEVKGSGVMAGA